MKSKKMQIRAIIPSIFLCFLILAVASGCSEPQEATLPEGITDDTAPVTQDPVQDTIDDVPDQHYAGIIASVNGEDITQEDIEEFTLMMPHLAGAGQDQIISELVAHKLLLQEAQRRGIRYSPEEIEEALSEIYQDPLLLENIPDDQYQILLKQQEQQMIFFSLVDASVTEQEALEYYQENEQIIQATFGDVSFDEIKEDLIQGLKFERKNLALNALANELMEQADIVFY